MEYHAKAQPAPSSAGNILSLIGNRSIATAHFLFGSSLRGNPYYQRQSESSVPNLSKYWLKNLKCYHSG